MKTGRWAVCVTMLMAACGGGGGGGTPPAIPPVPNLTFYTIGGTVSGMSGTGLVLTNDGGDNLMVNANGSFTFSTGLLATFPYSVAVQTQPSSPAQTCTVSNGSGTVTGNVTNVQVTCADTIGGTVSGASFTVVLQNNGGNNLSVGNGGFTFTTPLANGTAYNVTVQSSTPTQQCTVTNGSGTANGNVTNVQVSCADTIGGTISGLSGTVVLQNNGGDNLSINAVNGSFTFATAIANGTTYNVTVLTQPSVPAQTCTVANGSGTAGANITAIQITCTNGQWTWIKGANTARQAGTYGTLGTAAPGNTPGAKFGSVSWFDSSGNQWLFGGFGVLPDGITFGYQNELWKFSSGQWTWVGGVNTLNPSGTYGTKGTAAAANVPGGRVHAISWIDASNNLWLFGGEGFDSAGNFGQLNDLWKFSGGQWTWVSGANTRNQAGVYSGSPNALVPGARLGSVSWIDAGGNLWLFGGQDGNSLALNVREFNDLWKYTVGTDQWTFVSGSNVADIKGTYGTLGVASAANVPGARHGAVGWKDASGNMWLFGGYGHDSSGTLPLGQMNDLWKFDGTQWTWMKGSNIRDQDGVYGTLGTADAANVPGARFFATGQIDGSGNLWLFGGQGYGLLSIGELNDLWKYSISTGQWTWVSGSTIPTLNGSYGSQGAIAVGFPGSRNSSTSWIDASGDLWFFGGTGSGGSGTSGELNDLWRFRPQ